MYRRDSQGWIKYYDFIFLDMLSLQIAYVLAFAISGYGFNPYEQTIYRNISVIIELINLLVIFVYGTLNNLYDRGHYVEFAITFKHAMFVGALQVLYLFLVQEGQNFSRMTLVLTFLIYTILTYLLRILYKKYKMENKKDTNKRRLLLITTSDIAENVITKAIAKMSSSYVLDGIVLEDENLISKKIADKKVVADYDNVVDYVCKGWIDEVLIVFDENHEYPKGLIEELVDTGVTVHYNISRLNIEQRNKQIVEKLGDFVVLTSSVNYVSSRQLMIKRIMDIFVGIVGCVATIIFCIIIGPIIYISSPGPIFFKQERVGRNGKRFKMYKFRSMYMDAEERKAELMKNNQYGDARMFKLDFDPRVIGNTVMPNGSYKTGIGDFIRKTSIDEFPQFINVLKGDMSIVGTRPPLVSETNLYEPHHKVRLAIKPGITGMWQVSGRSNITDFEEVVKLDREYIENWNIGLDFKILLKTFLVVFKRDGSK